MIIQARILRQAMDLYLAIVYPGGAVPAGAAARVQAIRALHDGEAVPLGLLETDVADSMPSYALRLGQPIYPHMKLVVEPAPAGGPEAAAGTCPDYFLRVDAHDRHLHAPPGSPDEAWLASIRKSNKELSERIETAWSAVQLPTFKDFLCRQLQARKAAGRPPETP